MPRILKSRFWVYVHLKAMCTLATPKRNSSGSRKTLNAEKRGTAVLPRLHFFFFLPKRSSPERDSSAFRRGTVLAICRPSFVRFLMNQLSGWPCCYRQAVPGQDHPVPRAKVPNCPPPIMICKLKGTNAQQSHGHYFCQHCNKRKASSSLQ